VGPVARSVRPFRPGYRRGWSGHPVSSSVQTGKDQVDPVSSCVEIGNPFNSPGHPFRLVRSLGHFVRSHRKSTGPGCWSGRRSVCPFRPGNRPGPADQVGPVARSVRPFRPGNRTGPVDRVRSARSPGHV
ncbi:LDHB, partial [Symbiodinium necroappetens]